MEPILVTGGAGFIGSCFVRQSLAAGYPQVVNLDKLTYAGSLDSLQTVDPKKHVFVQGDIGDRKTVDRLFGRYRPSAVVHFAAESHVDRSIDGPAAFVQTNVVGTFELLDATLHYWRELPARQRERFRFLHVSTDEVYGSLGPTGRFTESTPYSPCSPYSASKAASDHFVGAYHTTYGLPTIVTHSSNNYGPYQFPEKLIPLTILKALAGEPLPIYGDGGHVRDWLHVEDHCRALRLVLHRGKPGERYHIGADAERANFEVVESICDLIDRHQPATSGRSVRNLIDFVEDRPGHDRRYAIDAGRIRHEMGWKPTVDFQEGLESTVRWYLDHRPWLERAAGMKHQRDRLGVRHND